MIGTGYFRRGFASLKFQRGQHDYERLLAGGWIEYDPAAPAGDDCRRTLTAVRREPCRHGYGWQCPRAVEEKRTA